MNIFDFSDLLKKFNFEPTLQHPKLNRQDCLIQVYLNDRKQSVEVSYSYEDDYFSIVIENEFGKNISGSFEALIDLKLWTDLFDKNIVRT